MADPLSSHGPSHGLIVRNPTRDQSRDTGLALVLICLIAALITRTRGPVIAATMLLVITMTVPALFRPAAVVWLTFSNILGSIVSRVLLSLVFFLIVTPVGLIRRMLGKDTLRLAAWKKDTASVFHERRHVYTPDDIHHPY